MNGGRLLRIGWESSRNTFTVGNGNRPGVIPERGRDRETGTSRGYLAPAGGGAPSISYMEGASLFSRRQGHCARVPPPASPPSAIGKGCRLAGELIGEAHGLGEGAVIAERGERGREAGVSRRPGPAGARAPRPRPAGPGPRSSPPGTAAGTGRSTRWCPGTDPRRAAPRRPQGLLKQRPAGAYGEKAPGGDPGDAVHRRGPP
jgi:hypothetical protein